MWLLVGRQPWETSRLIWLIVGTLIVVPLLTLAWVLHNRAIFRRKGERRGVAVADFSYRTDWHGRTISADWAQLQRSRFVTVDVDGPLKFYRCVDSELVRSVSAPFADGSPSASNDDIETESAPSRY